VHRFAGTGERNQSQREAQVVEKIRRRPMIVPCRFKADQDGISEHPQIVGQMLKILALIGQSQAASSVRRRRFDKNIVIVLGDIDRYRCQALWRIVSSGHGWRSSRTVGLAPQPSQESIVGHDRFLTYYEPEFVAKELRQLLAQVGCLTLYIEPGSPWENGYGG
jgi:hypothetical protein